jgi:hypothetical protein
MMVEDAISIPWTPGASLMMSSGFLVVLETCLGMLAAFLEMVAACLQVLEVYYWDPQVCS